MDNGTVTYKWRLPPKYRGRWTMAQLHVDGDYPLNIGEDGQWHSYMQMEITP